MQFYTGTTMDKLKNTANQNQELLKKVPNPPAVSGPTTYTNAQGQKQRGVYLDDNGEVDWSKKINEGISNGASADDIKSWNDSRNDKINNDATLGKYKNDATNSAALNYINAANAASAKKESDERNDFLARQEAEAERALRAKVDMAVGNLNGQKEQVGQSYEDLFRQLYLDKRVAEKNLPQQMAAMGYTGGLTESSALGLATNYSEALRKGEQGRIGTLSDLDRAITDTRLSGDISVAENASKWAMEQFNSYNELLRQQKEQANLDREYGHKVSRDEELDRQWQVGRDDGLSETEYQKKEQGALALAGIGDYSGVAELWGLSADQTKALVADFAKNNSLSENQSARDLAEFFAQYGDFSKLGAMGIDTGFMQKGQEAELAKLGGYQQLMETATTAPKTQYAPQKTEYSPPQVEASGVDAMLERFNNQDYSPEVINALLQSGYTIEQLQASGYTTPKPWDMFDASAAVMGKQEQNSGPSMAAGKIAAKAALAPSNEGKLNIIEGAYRAGQITEKDVEIMLEMLGL